jgi:membrane protein implicated in regulation of membrane protease activity
LIQAAVFAAISIILIPLTRPLAKKITKPSPQLTNVDAMINRTGLVIKRIDQALDSGQVRVDGQIWQANADGPIEEGSKIKVDKVIGARLYVSRFDRKEEPDNSK